MSLLSTFRTSHHLTHVTDIHNTQDPVQAGQDEVDEEDTILIAKQNRATTSNLPQSKPVNK